MRAMWELKLSSIGRMKAHVSSGVGSGPKQARARSLSHLFSLMPCRSPKAGGGTKSSASIFFCHILRTGTPLMQHRARQYLRGK